jgi:hypothetical protein
MGDFPFQPIYYNRQLLQIGCYLPEIPFARVVQICAPDLQKRVFSKTSAPPRPGMGTGSFF